MSRVHVSVFGSGLGHATRMLSVAEALAGRGDRVTFSSSGDAAHFIRRSGYRCDEVPLVDVSWTSEGSFSALDTTRNFPLIVLRSAAQLRAEARSISGNRPDVVLNDSVLSSVLAGRLSRVPTVTVLNQLRLEASTRTPPTAGKLIAAGSVTVVDWLWGRSTEVLLPDLPPPYTISEKNLWSRGATAKRARYVGFLMPPVSTDARSLPPLGGVGKPLVYWQVSGPALTRRPLLKLAFALADATKEEFCTIISAGDPSGRREPQKTSFGWFYEWCESGDALKQAADLLVSRAGHTSIAQFIHKEKPALLVPIPFQTEQEGNASKASKLGIAVKVEQADLDLPAYTKALQRLRSKEVKDNLARLGSIARGYDAVGEIVKVVTELSPSRD
jgi:UDP-N-acetylglucosamine--N-acetylmuramyl-(pentapeptide) pyrophosphoryl-undecaprenol N-acetylglucosamine transferase